MMGSTAACAPTGGRAGREPASLERLSERRFEALARFIQDNYGIKMPRSKKVMVEARLRRRMGQAGFQGLEQYLDYVFSPDGQRRELVHMVDIITTNKTEFFREPSHFELLRDQILPRCTAEGLGRRSSPLRLWSAACSSGEEPYTLAMVLREFAEGHAPFHFEILASDVSSRMLHKAVNGVYSEEEVAAIPMPFRHKYLLRSKDRQLALVQVDEALRRLVTFRRINLMADDFRIRGRLHVIFCRNVLIYFSKEDQASLVRRFWRCLAPGGYLFVGHSESLAGLDAPFSSVATTVYRRCE